MTIQIDGTNTLNKGAELMLLAIFEQILVKFPQAKIYYNPNEFESTLPTFLKKENVRKRWALQNSRISTAILRRLGLPYTYFTSKYALKNIDVLLDGAGFQFSDQWIYSKNRLDILEDYYRKLHEQGTKIVLLPQALGPFETSQGKRMVQIINMYVDIFIAREEVSYQYVINAGADKNKVWQYSDFTFLVEGRFPKRHEALKNKICIIPNKRMITHNKTGSNQYLNFMEGMIRFLEERGEKTFLLNHEGDGDLELCKKIRLRMESSIEIISGHNARETKGIIGASKIVISSRFHGVASALSQGVPCLATSWNHKYQMLFKDFNQYDTVLLPDGDWSKEFGKIESTLNDRDTISTTLLKRKNVLIAGTREMWCQIWEFIDN